MNRKLNFYFKSRKFLGIRLIKNESRLRDSSWIAHDSPDFFYGCKYRFKISKKKIFKF